MTKIIRFPKEFFAFSGIERPWLLKDYVFYYNAINRNTNINKINKPDVAFGDRLNWWTQAIVIGKILKFEYQLQFNIADYPETYFFKYPKSVFLPTNEFYRGINQFEYLTHEQYYDLVHNMIIPERMSNYLIINHWPKSIPFYGIDPLSLIQLKYPEMEHDLKKLFGHYIGVHLRRFEGIYYVDSDLSELTPELREEYKKESRYQNDSHTWSYIKDCEYFNQLDHCDGYFYISTDLPSKYYYEQWSRQYPDRIYDINFVEKKFMNIMRTYYGDESVEKHYKLIYRMIDYFALMYSKLIVCPKHYKGVAISSWAETAHRISSVPIQIFEAGHL